MFSCFSNVLNVASVRESDFTAQWFGGTAHLRGNIELVLALLVVKQNFLQ